MPEYLTDDQIEARFAALMSPLTLAPALEPDPIVHRGLVIQGDVAFLPGATYAPTSWPARRWTAIEVPTAIIPGDHDAYSHVLIPEGPGITLLYGAVPDCLALLSIPEDATVLVRHNPGEHGDLVLGGGLWSVRHQRVVVDGVVQPAERYRSLWSARFTPGDGSATYGGMRYLDGGGC